MKLKTLFTLLALFNVIVAWAQPEQALKQTKKGMYSNYDASPFKYLLLQYFN